MTSAVMFYNSWWEYKFEGRDCFLVNSFFFLVYMSEFTLAFPNLPDEFQCLKNFIFFLIVNQVAKDAELLSTGQVKDVTWVFFRSPNTGKVGASPELLKQLNSAGIKTEIAGDIPAEILEKAKKYAPTTKQ